jgi:hypothetical protein
MDGRGGKLSTLIIDPNLEGIKRGELATSLDLGERSKVW